MTLTVCIPTAGRGTRMGVYTSVINKALLPIDKKAVISHIISSFPEKSEFVIPLGEMGEQVRNYLNIAHPNTTFHFIYVDNIDGPNSGPGYSLLCCKDKLNKPFFFVSCDTLWRGDVLDTSFNWLGVSIVPEDESERLCNVEIDSANQQVISLHDKVKAFGENFRAFTGLCFIKDHYTFWDGLEDPEMITGEHQISSGLKRLVEKSEIKAIDIGWDDVGTIGNYREIMNRYEAYDFSKTNEFLYIVNGKVIKFFADNNVADKRVQRASMNQKVFPLIKKQVHQFYAYDFHPGKTLYEENNTLILKNLLDWLNLNLWKTPITSNDEMLAICQKFYKEKTLNRLEIFGKKYPGSDIESKVNSITVPSISDLMERVPWETLYDGIPCFLHGDLQFDNILFDQATENFLLLDWREDFGGCLEFGDIYYDYAKLNGGILLNYDYIKANLLQFEENGDEIFFDFAQRRNSYVYEEILHNFIRKNGHELNKVRLLVPLIYLNMSPLHHYPFDKILHALGRQMLDLVLNYQNTTFGRRDEQKN